MCGGGSHSPRAEPASLLTHLEPRAVSRRERNDAVLLAVAQLGRLDSPAHASGLVRAEPELATPTPTPKLAPRASTRATWWG